MKKWSSILAGERIQFVNGFSLEDEYPPFSNAFDLSLNKVDVSCPTTLLFSLAVQRKIYKKILNSNDDHANYDLFRFMVTRDCDNLWLLIIILNIRERIIKNMIRKQRCLPLKL